MKTTFLILLPILLTGCVPASAINRYGVQARLVDGANSAAIANRDVIVTIDGKDFQRRTNHMGAINVSASKDHYWTWALCGPVHASRPDAQIQLECEDYAPYRLNWSVFQFRQADGILDYREALDDRDRILLGDIQLNKR